MYNWVWDVKEGEVFKDDSQISDLGSWMDGSDVC